MCLWCLQKKHSSSNVDGDKYSVEVESFTHKNVNNVVVSKDYIKDTDRILIVDDFLAIGNAPGGLIEITRQANATLVGAAIAVEKAFQGGGDTLREKGIRVESLAIIESMSDGEVVFRPQSN